MDISQFTKTVQETTEQSQITKGLQEQAKALQEGKIPAPTDAGEVQQLTPEQQKINEGLSGEVDQLEGKKEFYPRAYEDQREHMGFDHATVFEEKDLRGTRDIKPSDGLVINGDRVIPIEIKSPKEMETLPTSADGTLKNDYISKERSEIASRIDKGELPRDVSRHEIFMAQGEHRAQQFKENEWDLRGSQGEDLEGKRVQVGYQCPLAEKDNVIEALKDKGIRDYEIREGVSTLLAIYDNPIS